MLYLALKCVREAVTAGSSDRDGTLGRGAATAAVKACLVSNARLGGDSVNRGMLLGALLGLIFGVASLPPEYRRGLVRGGEMAPPIHALAAVVSRHITASTSTPPPFGLARPLPYIPCHPSQGTIRFPRDESAKITAVGKDMARAADLISGTTTTAKAPPSHLWYLRGIGAIACLEMAGSRQGTVTRKCVAIGPALAPPPVDAAARVGSVLEEGDAAADRAKALAALSGGGNGCDNSGPPTPPPQQHGGGGGGDAVVTRGDLIRPALLPSIAWSDSVGFDPAAPIREAVSILPLPPAASSSGAASTGLPHGSGIFYYPSPLDLAARHASITHPSSSSAQ